MLPYIYECWNCKTRFYDITRCPDCQPKYVSKDGKFHVCGKFLY